MNPWYDVLKLSVVLVQVGCIVAVVIYALVLFRRLVRAHERIANALENVARKFRDDGKS